MYEHSYGGEYGATGKDWRVELKRKLAELVGSEADASGVAVEHVWQEVRRVTWQEAAPAGDAERWGRDPDKLA
jgi:hypothetical protein